MSLVVNRKARYEYRITDTYQAGISLTGAEVKSLRQGSASLHGSYVKILGDEAFLLNAQISPYQFADNRDYEPKRTRKLLLHRSELIKLQQVSQKKGWSIIPLSFDLVRNHIKVTIGIGKGKQAHEKRAVLRERDLQREMARQSWT